ESELRKVSVLISRGPNITGMVNTSPDSNAGRSIIDGDRLYRGTGAGPAVDGAGAFNVSISPGDYRLAIGNLPANTYVKSAMLGMTDVLTEIFHIAGPVTDPMEIVLGVGSAEI